MPITISETPMMLIMGPGNNNRNNKEEVKGAVDYIIPYDSSSKLDTHKNILDNEFVEYVENIDTTLYDTI